MTSPSLEFKPVNWEKDLDHAVRFREDSFICSFGDAKRFNPSDYVDALMRMIKEDPESAVHIWLSEQLVGQMELGQFKLDPSAGYIDLCYLIPEMRGKGYSNSLDAYAMSFLGRRGFKKAYLSVSPSNKRAMSYYGRMGWTSCGVRPDSPEVILMIKSIP
ncbi:MAG: GNAT family N-acetyltransferase [Bdellovibrionia bacterium]